MPKTVSLKILELFKKDSCFLLNPPFPTNIEQQKSIKNNREHTWTAALTQQSSSVFVQQPAQHPAATVLRLHFDPRKERDL